MLIVVSVEMHRISLKIKIVFGSSFFFVRYFKGSWKFAIESSRDHDQYEVVHW